MGPRDLSLDIRHNSRDSKYLARRIWEALFRELHAENWKELDSFLCDLYMFADFISVGRDKFYFHWDSDKSGYTDTLSYRQIHYPCYYIEVLQNEIQLTYFPAQA